MGIDHDNDHDEEEQKGGNNDTTKTPPKLPLFSLPPIRSPEYPGICKSPLLPTLKASVPFRWEEQPGKPYPVPGYTEGLDIVKGLELPPRLAKTSSPTTVLEGPYVPSRRLSSSRSLLESSSFRFLKKKQVGVSYYDGSVSFSAFSWNGSPGRGLLGSGNVIAESDDGGGGGGGDGSGGGGAGMKVTRLSRKRSRLSLSLAKSHFWASIYGALKQIIPRRSSKWRKEAL